MSEKLSIFHNDPGSYRKVFDNSDKPGNERWYGKGYECRATFLVLLVVIFCILIRICVCHFVIWYVPLTQCDSCIFMI